MLINQVFEKHLGAVHLLLLELSIEYVMYSLIHRMQNIYDFIQVTSALTQINELVQHVTDTDIKKLNYNSYQIHMFHANYVNEKDTNLKYYQ